jgi:protein-tyrosine kinase
VSLGAVGNVGAGRELLDPGSPSRPHFEELADNLLERGVRSVVVTGVGRGVGGSTVCLGLGAALAGMGRAVAVVDCNFERPELHRLLGEPNFVGLTSALTGGKPPESYGREVAPGLLVVPTGPLPADPDARRNSPEFTRAVRGLEEGREMVVLDAPVAAEVLSYRALVEELDGVLLVVHAARTAKAEARAVTDALLDAGANLLGVALNGSPPESP